MKSDFEELNALVQQAWSSLLGLEARCGDASSDPSAADELVGCVGFTGRSCGAVMLVCTAPLARLAAATMFGIPIEQIAGEQVRDALGELTNVVAGNFVSRCITGCQVELPELLDSADYRRRLASCRLIADLSFECPAGCFRACVLEA